MTGVYKITNTITGDCYIGSSKDIASRWKKHIVAANNYGKSKRYEYPLYKAIYEYGLSNFSFTVLELCEQDKLIELEQKYYVAYNPKYNSIQPIENPSKNENVKKKMKTACKIAFATHSEKTKEKIYLNLQKGWNCEAFNQKKYAPKKIKAINIKTNEEIIFDSLYQAEKELGVSRGNICQILNGNPKRKQSKGYVFEYVNDVM